LLDTSGPGVIPQTVEAVNGLTVIPAGPVTANSSEILAPDAALKADPQSSGREHSPCEEGSRRSGDGPTSPRGKHDPARRVTFESVGGPKGGTSRGLAVSRETSRVWIRQDAEAQRRS
jgi:hypothetical protein